MTVNSEDSESETCEVARVGVLKEKRDSSADFLSADFLPADFLSADFLLADFLLADFLSAVFLQR